MLQTNKLNDKNGIGIVLFFFAGSNNKTNGTSKGKLTKILSKRTIKTRNDRHIAY